MAAIPNLIEYHFVWLIIYRYQVLRGDLVRPACEILEIQIFGVLLAKTMFMVSQEEEVVIRREIVITIA